MRVFPFLLLFSTIAHCAFEQTEVGARAKALGGSYTGLADDAWGMFHNPAGLAAITHREVSFLYVPSQFELLELAYGAGAAAVPVGVGVCGVGARSYGFNVYREFTGTVSWAFPVSAIRIGLALNYHSVSILNYGSAATIGIDIGFTASLTDRLTWGVAAKNVNSATIGSSREPLPQTFSSGFAYRPADNLNLFVDYRKEIGYSASSRLGFEYWIVPQFAVRGGMSDEPPLYAAGTGMKFSVFQLDYAVANHPDLGWTQEMSVTIRWGD